MCNKRRLVQKTSSFSQESHKAHIMYIKPRYHVVATRSNFYCSEKSSVNTHALNRRLYRASLYHLFFCAHEVVCLCLLLMISVTPSIRHIDHFWLPICGMPEKPLPFLFFLFLSSWQRKYLTNSPEKYQHGRLFSNAIANSQSVLSICDRSKVYPRKPECCPRMFITVFQ